MGLNRTPIISQQRLNCATFYTFPSAMEDIGLNINERNNKVSLSHYVVLNIPKIQLSSASGSMDEMNSNLIRMWKVADGTAIGGLSTDTVDINSWLPAALQNYAMNFETNLRNQSSYDFSSSKSVTERVFWKMMQKVGALHLKEFKKDNLTYYCEADSDVTNHIIKGFGYITASSQSSKAHTIDTETYIMIPSSYGQMQYIMKEAEDNNYVIGKSYTSTNPEGTRNHLEGHVGDNEYQEGFRQAFYDNYLDTQYDVVKQHITDDVAYNAGDYINDALEMDFDINDLKTVIADGKNITYDDLAILPQYRKAAQYDFNAILVYYTISDSVGNNIATNLYGIIVLDSAQSEDGKTIISEIGKDIAPYTPMTIKSYTKTSSSGAQFGSSYSIRLDIQTASIYDNTNNIITDISTAESSTLTDFNEVVSNLNDCVKIMRSNAVAVSNMNLVVQSTKQLVADTSASVKSLGQTVNDILHGNIRDISANDVSATSIHVGEIIFSSADKIEVVNDKEQVTGLQDSPIRIYSYDGEDQYGELDGSVLKYKNIKAEQIDTSVIVPNILGIPKDGITFNPLSGGRTTEHEMVSISENGVLSSEDSNINYDIREVGGKRELTEEDDKELRALWNQIDVRALSTGQSDLSILFEAASNQKYIQTTSGLNTNYLNIKTIIPMLIWKIKDLESRLNSQTTE